MIKFNLIGLAMTAVCVGFAYLVGFLIGDTSQRVAMPIAGILMLVVDAAYRWRTSPRNGLEALVLHARWGLDGLPRLGHRHWLCGRWIGGGVGPEVKGEK